MKEKLENLRTQIKSLLAEAETLINEGKFKEASDKHTEAKTLREQAEVLKAHIEATEKDKLGALEDENAALKKAAAEPKRLPFDAEPKPGDLPADDSVNSFAQLKFGTLDPALKAVIADLYGNKFDYEQARLDQMKAFVKYVRFGDVRLSADEAKLLSPSAKTMLLRPETLKAEIMAGRTVGEIKATLEEGANDLGGYLVPEDYRVEIIKRLMGAVTVRGRCRVITTTRDAVEWPRLEGGNSQYTSAVRVKWVDETPASATTAATNPTFGLVKIPVHTVMARIDLSRNLLEDSAFNLLDLSAELFGEAMAIDEDAQFVTGQGAGTPYGVLGDRSSGTSATPVTGISQVVSGNASNVTSDGLYDLVYGLDAQYRGGAVLVLAKNTLRDCRKLKDGNGQYLWQPGLQAGQPSTILGYPVLESESMPAIAANNFPILFGDFRSGYIIVDRVGMSVERVSDVTTVGTNTVALFARRRLGGQVVAPWSFQSQKIST